MSQIVATAPDMKNKILDVAADYIAQHGERSLRLREVAKAASIALPTLYHYFSGREELIVAAHARRLRLNVAATADPFTAAARQCETKEEFLVVLNGIFRHSFQPERVAVRKDRVEIIGNAVRRADLQERVKYEIDESLASSIEVLEYAKDQGWLRHDINSRAFAMLIMSMISGLVIPELFNDEELLSECQSLAWESIAAVVLSDSPQPQLNPGRQVQQRRKQAKKA